MYFHTLRVHHAVDFPIEVDAPLKAGIRPAGVVAVQLLHRHALFLYGVLFLDPGAEISRPVYFDELFGFELADVVYDQGRRLSISAIIPSYSLKVMPLGGKLATSCSRFARPVSLRVRIARAVPRCCGCRHPS